MVAAVGGAEPTLTCNSSAHGDGFAQAQLWFNKPSTDPQRWQFQLCQPAALPEAFQGPQCLPRVLLGCSGSAGFHTWAVPRSAKPDIPARKGILTEERTLPGVLRAVMGEFKAGHEAPHFDLCGDLQSEEKIPVFSYPYVEVENQHAERDEWQNRAFLKKHLLLASNLLF